jgi:hypothetical protein
MRRAAALDSFSGFPLCLSNAIEAPISRHSFQEGPAAAPRHRRRRESASQRDPLSSLWTLSMGDNNRSIAIRTSGSIPFSRMPFTGSRLLHAMVP